MFKREYKRLQVCLLLPLLLAYTNALAVPTLNAESYILMDAETGAVIASKNADLRLPPASLTKIMSSYLYFKALKNKVLDINEMVNVSREAWGSNVVGSKMFIEVDTQVSVNDLLHGVIVQSGNDASIALAEAISGDEAAFAEQMNEEALLLGLKNSHFKNSTGLPAKNHYSSANDMAILVKTIIEEFPELYKLYSIKEYTYNNITQQNRNKLLTKYAGADGVKTGYTKAAGYSLVASVEQNGRRLISVVMKTKSSKVREVASIKLLNYGFKQYKNALLFEKDDIRLLPIAEGLTKQVKVTPTQRGIFTIRRQDSDIKALFTPINDVIPAPIKKGEVLGTITVVQGDKTLQQTPVIALEDVQQKGMWDLLLEEIKVNYLGHPANEREMLSEW